MAKKYIRIKIENIEAKIQSWIMIGDGDDAEALYRYFENHLPKTYQEYHDIAVKEWERLQEKFPPKSN